MNEIIKIKISEIDDFKNHPYKVELGDELNDLVESIKLNGLFVISEKLFIIPTIPSFIYGAIKIAIHTTGIIPNIYKRPFVFSLSLVIYPFSLK